jgi:sulfur carrier protein ThiS
MELTINLNGKAKKVNIKEGTSIAELFKKIGVPREVTFAKKNGKLVPESEVISKDDRVEVIRFR